MLEIRPSSTLTVPSFASRTVNLDVDLGALAIRYVFSTTITDSDPGNGKLRLSATQQDAALTVRADTLDVNGADVTGILDAFDDSTSATKGVLRIYKVSDPTKWLVFDVTALASPAGYRNITVENIAASDTSPFADGDMVLLSFQPAGDKGEDAVLDTETAEYVPRPVTAPFYVRNVGDWMRQTKYLRDFAPSSTEPSDWSETLQTAVNETIDAGGELNIPAGLYDLGTEVIADVSANSGVPSVSRKRLNIKGQGQGNTAFRTTVDGMNALRLLGDSVTSGGHGYCEFSDFSFVGGSPTSRTSFGLAVEDMAYARYRNLSFHNLFVGLTLTGALSSTFDNLIFNESTKGVSSDEGPVDPNANIWIGCQWRACTTYAFDAFTTMSGTTFLMPRIENCGTHGNAATGGFNFRSTGATGEVAANIFGGYIEGNGGGFDIQIAESAGLRAVLNVYGGDFRRIRSDRYVTTNIKTGGDIDLNLYGVGFTNAGTYAADAARPFLTLSAGTRLRDSGCRWGGATGGPTTGQSMPYAGFVQGTLGASVTGILPNGWTVAQSGTGIFVVTHSLGHSDYAVSATCNATSDRSVVRVAKAANTFSVVLAAGATKVDDDFSFQMSVLKPRS
ncbi:hypothetical protein VQ042_01355 [Aurantimonas sp. A2-1-M11]|uniref:hypothetical protein n=1 Tax=Aurantimonas sp. A2-1-M11 TaxID=3113712 RepID=UPI002F93C81C